MSGEYQGFWSYVHADDNNDGGRISQLARDVVDEYEMLTGEKIELFLDRDAIEWGSKWRDEIDEGLGTVAFFIPVITPRYVRSAECRREFNAFARRLGERRLKELLLPLHYVDVPGLDSKPGNEELDDSVLLMIRDFQIKDWRELRHVDRSSKEYRQAVTDIAQHLAMVNRRAEETHLMDVIDVKTNDDESDELGLIDRMVRFEEALPDFLTTNKEITAEIETIGDIAVKTTDDLNKTEQRGGFAPKLILIKRMAAQLKGPTDRISANVNSFVSQIHDIDDGLRAMVEQVKAEAKNSPEEEQAVEGFFQSIREMSTSAHTALDSLQGMINALTESEKISRDLRPAIRRLRHALTTMVEAREITDSWMDLIEAPDAD